MTKPTHPTAQQLMDTVSEMLGGDRAHHILVDDVIIESGVSRSSIYHHFGDFQGLIEATLLLRFSVNVDADAKAMASVAENATSKEDYWDRIRKLSAATQTAERAPVRAERARIIALAATNQRFGKALAIQQDRLTDAMAGSISIAQKKGWVTNNLDSRAIALFLQAYSLGRAVDDVAGKPIDNKKWQQVVDVIISSLEG